MKEGTDAIEQCSYCNVGSHATVCSFELESPAKFSTEHHCMADSGDSRPFEMEVMFSSFEGTLN